MAYKGFHRHNVVVTGSNDGTKQVSKDAWNDDLNRTGMLGFAPTTASITISAGLLLVTDTWTVVDAEGAPTTDDLTNITTTNTLTEDVIYMIASAGQTITIKHAFGGAGQIFLLSGVDKILSENVPVQLIRRGADWYEFGSSGSVFPDSTFRIQDNVDSTKQLITSLGGATTAKSTTFTFVHTLDRAITFPDADTTLAGLSVAQSWTAKQTFQDDSIEISNPADTFQYIITAGAISADRILNLPVITGTDTLATLGMTQIFTGSNTFGEIIHTGRHQYDKGADVTSASEITLGTDGNVFDITGTTTINTIAPTGWQAGSIVVLQFDGTLTVTHNSGGTNDILLAGAVNYSATAGKTLTLFFNGTDWVEIARNGTGGGSDTPWTANHDFDTFYYDMQVQTAPSSPATDNVRHYVKTIDANNDGYFVKMKKAGAFVEVQIA